MGQHFRFKKPMWATQTSGSRIYCFHVLLDARKLSLILCHAKRGQWDDGPETRNALCCREKLLFTRQALDSAPRAGTLSAQIELRASQLRRIWHHHISFQCIISWLLFGVGRERDFKKLN